MYRARGDKRNVLHLKTNKVHTILYWESTSSIIVDRFSLFFQKGTEDLDRIREDFTTTDTGNPPCWVLKTVTSNFLLQKLELRMTY